MPTISMFFGIIIRMYYSPKEHNPPHIHAYYQDYKTTIRVQNCEIIEGQIPSRQLRLIEDPRSKQRVPHFAGFDPQ